MKKYTKDQIIKDFAAFKYSHLLELRTFFFGLGIDFLPLFLFAGLGILSLLKVDQSVLITIGFLIFFYSVFHFYKIFIDSQKIILNKYQIEIPNLAKSLKFIFVADIHFGPEYYGAGEKKVQNIVEIINSSDCDLVIFGGDFLCDELDARIVLLLEQIRTKNKIGVYGNHDTLYLKEDQPNKSPDQFLRMMSKSGIKFLNNNGFSYGELYFGGITDLFSFNFDIERAFKDSNLNQLRVLISHNPDIIDFLVKGDNVSLVLSGHTHAGQIILPIIGNVLPIPCKNTWLVRGLYKLKDDVQLFITQGAGFSKTRMRIGTQCEVCEITLTPE
ncbi:MAG: metallophosphoesterase [Candidatus Dojkabacteria bacterium]